MLAKSAVWVEAGRVLGAAAERFRLVLKLDGMRFQGITRGTSVIQADGDSDLAPTCICRLCGGRAQ